MRRAFILDLDVDDRAVNDLLAGGVFIRDATVDFDDEVHIMLRAGDNDVIVVARAVQVTEEGAGFQIEGMTRELRERIAALVALAKHVDGDQERRKKFARASTATDAIRRAAAGSIPPSVRRAARVADGSLSPIAALAPTQRDEALAEKARSAQIAAETDTDTDD